MWYYFKCESWFNINPIDLYTLITTSRDIVLNFRWTTRSRALDSLWITSYGFYPPCMHKCKNGEPNNLRLYGNRPNCSLLCVWPHTYANTIFLNPPGGMIITCTCTKRPIRFDGIYKRFKIYKHNITME